MKKIEIRGGWRESENIIEFPVKFEASHNTSTDKSATSKSLYRQFSLRSFKTAMKRNQSNMSISMFFFFVCVDAAPP